MNISVLMSVYENEMPFYLDRAIKSVWTDQTLKPSQIILVQDGVLPTTLLSIINKWKTELEDVLVVLVNETNLGLTKSLNIGLRYVSSKYIARMDSDDISDPFRFERQYNYLEEHPEIGVVGGAIQEIDEKGKLLNIRQYPQTNNEIRRYIIKACPLAHPTVMMRTCIFDSGITYNELYRNSQDIALWFDIINAGYKISNLSDITLHFRRTDNTYQRRNKIKAFNEFRIWMKGIKSTYGFSYKYIFPISRLLFRLSPIWLIKIIYNSRLRNKILQ